MRITEAGARPERRADWTRPSLADAARFSGRLLLVLALGAVVGLVVVRLPLVFLPTFAALALTTLLRPLARRLERRRVPRSLAALAVVALAVAVVGGALAFIVPRTVRELSQRAPELQERVRETAAQATEALPGPPTPLNALGQRAAAWAGAHGRELAAGALKGARATVEVASGVLLAVALTFFFVRDGERLEHGALAPLSPVRRRLVHAGAARAWVTLGRWLRGTVLIALTDAVGIGAGLLVLRVPLALPLAALVFLGAFVPIIGATIAGGAAVLVAWAAGGTRDALIVVGILLAVQQLEGNVLEPVIMGRALPLHPAVVLLAVTAGTVLAGVAGALVAVPLLATATSAVQGFRDAARALRPPAAPEEAGPPGLPSTPGDVASSHAPH